MRVPATEILAQLTARFGDFGADAPAMVLKRLMLLVRQQSIVMGFADVFLMLAVLFVGSARWRCSCGGRRRLAQAPERIRAFGAAMWPIPIALP